MNYGHYLITALTIQTQGDNIHCEGLLTESGKWMGCIWHYKEGTPHALLISTEAIFKSEKEALENVEDLVTKIRAADLKEEMRKNHSNTSGDQNGNK